MPNPQDFVVKDCALVSLATGVRAQSLPGLREGLLAVPADSVYHHFWGGLLRARFDDPEFSNDFAVWVRHALHDLPLAERLAVIDPADFVDAEALRQEVLEVVEQRLDEIEAPVWAPRDRQFHFLRGQLVVFDTGRRVHDPRELVDLLPQLSPGSVFYHLIDARRREPVGQDDFHAWLVALEDGYEGLIARLAQIDPYFVSLPELRAQYAAVIESHFAGVPA
ncbi:DUF5752 family protein [Immundisolibacter sp.]|uniref:DUF5752 family protein n=1 Tax=Immundisolibacter sp. TaxID=1934948 RepID=UPI00262AC578|nr:DUF5752 family protein [Immundisolibacter sp.]MDD3652482.1 DUF5752 family protein [Immundisolibacter sp.]